MATTPASRLPQFITDGGIETHIIFNMGVELPHFSAFPLNDSAAGRDVIRSYYRDYLPVARAAGRSFLFATDSWRASPDWGRPARLRPGAAKAEQRDIGDTLRRAR
jgi:homocysteine S-methyltransferase